MTEADIRALFPGVGRRRYLNAASAALAPSAVGRAVRRVAARQAERGIDAFPDDMAEVEACHERAARRIGAERSSDVALVASTADGLARVAEGFPWEPGDEVVLGDLEYPANVYPWAVQADRGVRIRVVRSEHGRLSAGRLIEAIGPRTRVVAVSSVQFTSGYRVDLDALAAACRERDVFLAVDAIQSLGVLPIDVRALGIGCLAADGRKWLFGPAACSILYVAPEWSGRIRPSAPGAPSVENIEDFLQWTAWADDDGTVAIDGHWRERAGRFESGFPNVLGAAGLAAALEVGERIGVETIRARVTALASRLAAAADERGWPVYGPRDDAERAGIVTFVPPGDAETIGRRLVEEGFSLTVRGGRLRASPHAYNTADEIDDLVAALERIAG